MDKGSSEASPESRSSDRRRSDPLPFAARHLRASVSLVAYRGIPDLLADATASATGKSLVLHAARKGGSFALIPKAFTVRPVSRQIPFGALLRRDAAGQQDKDQVAHIVPPTFKDTSSLRAPPRPVFSPFPVGGFLL